MENTSIIPQVLKMDENDKIIHMVKTLGANCYENAVTLEQVIEKAIEMGITETYPRGKADGHPWYPRTSVMMGVGSETAIEANEEFHLHRRKVKRAGVKGRKSTVMVYWFDPFTKHEVVTRKTKATSKKKIEKAEAKVEAKEIRLTLAEKKAKAEENSDKFIVVNGKLVSRTWIAANPEKAEKLYGIK